MLKAVIFDFDGVICDSEALHYRALNTVFNRYGVNVSKEHHWDTYLGLTDVENIEAVNRDYKMGLDAAGVQRLKAEKKDVFDALASTERLLIDGVESFVAMLTEQGIRRAICSGAVRSDIDLMLGGTRLAEAFEVIVTADDVAKGKPDPEGYRLALEKLNASGQNTVNPAECVVIEDSHWGIEAARAAGMCPVAVTNTYSREQLEDKAELVLERIDLVSVEQLQRMCR